jgi:hypothetical protein
LVGENAIAFSCSSRLQLYDLVWSAPLTAVAPQFGISDVALKKICARFDIPVPPRGYWAKLRASKPTTKIALPARAAGMDDEVVVGGRNRCWYGQLTDEEILGPLPEPPSFPEDIPLVRDRIRKIIGKVSVARTLIAQHPAIARLIALDDARRQKQLTATYTFSWDGRSLMVRLSNAGSASSMHCFWRWPDAGANPRFGEGGPGDQQTPAGRRKGTGQGAGPDQLRFAILAEYDRDQERASWQDGEGGRLERFIQEIAVEVVTSAEISYQAVSGDLSGACDARHSWRRMRVNANCKSNAKS